MKLSHVDRNLLHLTPNLHQRSRVYAHTASASPAQYSLYETEAASTRQSDDSSNRMTTYHGAERREERKEERRGRQSPSNDLKA